MKQPELILDMRGLEKTVLALLNNHVQTKLFALGYTWAAGEKLVQYLDAPLLRICSPYSNPFYLTFSMDHVLETSGPSRVFSYGKANLFLDAARGAAVIRTKIKGIKVSISDTDIHLDASDLLAEVGELAKVQQVETFGTTPNLDLDI